MFFLVHHLYISCVKVFVLFLKICINYIAQHISYSSIQWLCLLTSIWTGVEVERVIQLHAVLPKCARALRVLCTARVL